MDQKFLYIWSSIFLLFVRILFTFSLGFSLHVDQYFLYIWNCILFIFWSGFCLVLSQDVSLILYQNFLCFSIIVFLTFWSEFSFNHNLLYISIRIFLYFQIKIFLTVGSDFFFYFWISIFFLQSNGIKKRTQETTTFTPML